MYVSIPLSMSLPEIRCVSHRERDGAQRDYESQTRSLWTTLHNEVLDHHGEVNNFASLLRCSCLIYRAKANAPAVVPDHRGTAAAIMDAAE